MKITSFAVLFITLILFIPLAHAYAKTIIINDTIIDGSVLQETLTIDLVNNVHNVFSLKLPDSATAVTVNNEPAVLDNSSVHIPLSCSNCTLVLSYTFTDGLEKVQGKREFSRTLFFPESPKRLLYQVTLPKGYGITPSTTEPSVVPKPDVLSTDGEHIIVIWDMASPEFPIRHLIAYQSYDLQGNVFATFSSELAEWPVIFLLFVFFALGILLGYFWLAKRFAKEKKVSAIIPSALLSPDEKAMLTVIRKKKKMHQRDLAKDLNWSKSKVSAVIANLDYKEIIKRTKIGRNYEVELIKELEEF